MLADSQDLPAPLAEEARRAWAAIGESAGAALEAQLEEAVTTTGIAAQLARVLACSPFVAELLRRRPRMLLELLSSGELSGPLEEDALRAELEAQVSAAGEEWQVALRRWRQRHMLRILWRDFCRLANTLETVHDTSLLAEAAIAVALSRIEGDLQRRFGAPHGRHSGEAQRLIVLAMGKLGARELNVSSDIDLMFVYPEGGETDGAQRSLSNEEFFTRAGRALIAALDEPTADGFVFRVDMRLRPYGESGSLVHSFSALESYYQEQGRDWERYALVKARPLTGDERYRSELVSLLRPFVFRRYVDFGVIESLRGMKRMISGEIRRKGLQDNIKLGPGGIREIEFIAQCLQLIRGGRDPGLQQRELLPVLAECVELGLLPHSAAQELRDAYLFLRDSEHAIQGYGDRQSQDLPVDPLPRAAMATVMGCADWACYRQRLDRHRTAVQRHFADLIADPAEDEAAADAPLPWGPELDAGTLSELGFSDPQAALQALRALRENNRVVALQTEGWQRLDQFMPLLLRSCGEAPDPDLSLARVLPLVSAVVRRSAYLVLLTENPPALMELVTLCGASPWLAEQLSRHPVLLDEFLDRASLYTAPDRALLQQELRQQVARLTVDDLEAHMEALRYFKASHVLRVAASELVGRLPLMWVSDKLTWIAEVILEQVLALAWSDLTRRYGEPSRDGNGSGFVVYAYGKLGGIELGYGSDLDLVFIYDAAHGGSTDGQRSIDNAVFYTRLGQRMIHILETRMTLGQLYEVDMRLRPSGDSGLLVSTLQGFAAYQRESAWTWEHQALVRARFVAGDPGLAEAVDAVRRDVLCLPRDPVALGREVVTMREKMRDHLLPDACDEAADFDLKQGRGGIVDIEFMVQYAVLAWSHREPELTRWSDNVRILETLGREGFFEQRECDALTEAYLTLRSAAHQLSLQQQPGVVRADRFGPARTAVMAKWRALFASCGEADKDKFKQE